ncbi:MAG: cardiolipin synthase [Deltaproteobacteria bacterium]|nr:cardiolipin synthase [Deltaproteobacteria bacterium]
MIHLINDLLVRVDVLLALHLAVAIGASVHIVLTKEEPRAAVGWVGVVWLSPILGTLLYYILGINRIRRSAVSLMGRDNISGLDYAAVRQLDHVGLLTEPSIRRLAHVGNLVAGLPLLEGNQITPLINGDQAYPEMLKAIAGAQKSIMLSTYIFDNDDVGAKFVAALSQALTRGVEVRVLVDATGSRYSYPSIMKPLRRAGIRAARFMPNFQPTRIAAINLRSHRKILVIDGRLGFTGGMNIRQGNCIQERYPHPIQDLHFRVAGPVVAHLRQAFIEDWVFTTKERLTGEIWRPAITEQPGQVLARGILDGPDRDFEKILWTILGAIASAKHRIRIVTPYFLPDATTVRFLCVAAMSGIEVEIILPAKNNIKPVHWAAMATLPPLLEKGCRVYLSEAPFDHSKVMLVDDAWSMIGSANWDARSLRLNFEFNVECFSGGLAAGLHAIFESKLARSQPLTLDQLIRRPTAAKIRDGVVRLAAPYL